MSYLTTEQADAYFAERLHSDTWAFAAESDKPKALAQATRLIDRLRYRGCKTEPDQENAFPRGGDPSVPQDILEACAEIAIALLDGVDPESEMTDIGINNQGYSSVRSTYDANLTREHMAAGIPSATAWNLLKPWLADGKSITLVRVS